MHGTTFDQHAKKVLKLCSFPIKIQKKNHETTCQRTSQNFQNSVTLKIVPNSALKRRKVFNFPNFFSEANIHALSYFIIRLLRKNAIISIVSLLTVLVIFFSKYMKMCLEFL